MILNISLPFDYRDSFGLFDDILELDVNRRDILKTLLPLQSCPFRLEPINAPGYLLPLHSPFLIGEMDTFLDYV
jgi:hypothetical protein